MKSEQTDLFPPHTRVRKTDPQTSRDAAESVTSERIRKSQSEVLSLFYVYGPMTDKQLVERAAIRNVKQSESGLRTRRSELVTLGKLKDTGKRKRLDSGRKAIVWGKTW